MRYFANLTADRIVLWCYHIWYPFFATRYFDPSPALWFTSLGISAIIGIALGCCSMFCGFSQKGGGRGATALSRFAQYFD